MKTTNRKFTSIALMLLALAAASVGNAAVIASEDFETYSPGALSGQAGGSGWTGAWTAPGASTRADVVDTTANPLSFTPTGGAPIYGATRALEVQSLGSGIIALCGARQLATPINQTFYVSYLVRYTGSGTWAGFNNTFTLHLSTSSSSTASLNFGLRGGTPNEFVIRHGTGAPVAGASTGGDLTNNITYLLVCRMNWDSGAGAFTSANMWLNPTFSANVDKPNGDASTNGFTSGPITHVFFRHALMEMDDIVQADEVKIGMAWTDVVPPLGDPLPQVGVSTSPTSYIPVPAQTVTAGNSITVYAVALDAGGNYLSNTPATWSLVNVTGGIVGSDIVPVNNGRSAIFTGHRVGSANLRATPPTGALVYNDSGLITVQAAPASQVRVETAADGSGVVVPTQVLAPGSTLTVYAISRDPYENFLGNISATWSLQNKIGGVADGDLTPASGPSATFTANRSGAANIRASSGALASVDSGLIIVSQPLTWLGGSGNTWNFTAPYWDIGGIATNFYDMDATIFDWLAGANTTVNVVTNVSPLWISIDANGPWTFTGPGGIHGMASLTNKSGSKLTLLTSNSYTGRTEIIFGSELQVGNGGLAGTLGTGPVYVGTGGTSPIFNRTDPPSAPLIVSNVFSGPNNPAGDFTIEIKSGAVELRSPSANFKAKAIVRTGATLILSSAGTDLGSGTVLGGFGATNLWVEAGATCKHGLPNAAGDHLTAAGRYVRVDGIYDANGISEAFGILIGNGILDNTGTSNAVFTIMQGNSDVANGGIGNGGEVYTWSGLFRNTGPGLLGITKDGTNTLILANANTYGGDTRVINGGVLELGHANAMQNSTYDQQSGDTGTLSFGNLTSVTLGGLKSGSGKTLPLQNASAAAVALTIGGNGQTNTYAGNLSGPGSLTKTGGGIQTLSGTNTYSGTTTVSQGTLLVNGGLSGTGQVTVSPNGTLGGIGFINGPVVVNGTLRPGNNNIGKLTVNNTVTLAGTTIMEISRTTTTNSDNLTATSIQLGGSLVVTNLTGTLQAGNSFQLFSGSLSGSISPASLPPLWPGLSWDTSALNTAGTITVVGTPLPPAISSVSTSGGQLNLAGSGGVEGATYYIISTNNVSAPRANWPRVATNTFGPGGTFSISFPISLSVTQAYYGILIP